MKEVDFQCSELRRCDLLDAVDLTARAMQDNPPYMAIFGQDRSRRERGVNRFYRATLISMGKLMLAAYDDSRVVGVLAADPPGTCMPSLGKQLKMLPELVRMGNPTDLYRGLVFVKAMKRHDLQVRHWHIGPVAVEPDMQGRGIGKQLMSAICLKIDQEREVAFLETEKPENVRLYEKFGFEVIEEDRPLGVTQWYMRRAPKVVTTAGG